MASQSCLLGVLLAFIAIHHASALRCWSCSSDLALDCDDHFNGTYIRDQHSRFQHMPPGYNPPLVSMPILKECDDYLGRLSHERPVCIKVVRTIPSSGRRIIRECRSLPYGQEIGKCHEPTQRGERVEFCEYCDRDSCNSAKGLTINLLLASLLPISLLVIFRQ